MGKFIDLSGMRFGRILVISRVDGNKKDRIKWNCICDCGNKKVLVGANLKIGDTKSCGCYQSEVRIKRSTKHGYSFSGKMKSEYSTWANMISRCENKNINQYKNYGGRGVYVCDRWHDFKNFINDMGDKPTKYHSIERIDVNGNYEPSNCRWATSKEQSRNRTDNKWIEYNGVKMVIVDWAAYFGVNSATLYFHLKRRLFSDIVEFYRIKKLKS